MPTDSYIHRVIAAYRQTPDRMGDFPLPSFDVVLAAEVIKDYITPSQYSHAVEIAELSSGYRRVFVIGNSGVPGALNVDLAGATATLGRVLGGQTRLHQVTTPYDFYEPQHRDLVALLESVSPGFDGQGRLVRLAQVEAAIANFYARIVDIGTPAQDLDAMRPQQRQYWQTRIIARGQDVYRHYNGDANVPSAQQIADRVSLMKTGLRPPGQGNQEKEAVISLFAAGAALRLRLVDSGERQQIRMALQECMRRLDKLSVRPWLKAIAAQFQPLLDGHPGSDVLQPGARCQLHGIQSGIDGVFRLLNQSRFCAEPRVFAAIRAGRAGRGALVSQVCFWSSGTDGAPNPNEYQVIGPVASPNDASRSGSYMWACSSCRARSRQMLSGISCAVTLPAAAHEV